MTHETDATLIESGLYRVTVGGWFIGLIERDVRRGNVDREGCWRYERVFRVGEQRFADMGAAIQELYRRANPRELGALA